MDTNDFSNIPQSIAEIRADKERKGELWTARDALISMLRDIDSGKIVPSKLFISYLDDKEDRVRYYSAGGKLLEILGLIRLSTEVLIETVTP